MIKSPREKEKETPPGFCPAATFYSSTPVCQVALMP